MAGKGLPREVRRRLYSFGREIASPFSDTRRQRFLTDMVKGLVIGGHVHLTKVARAISDGKENIHSIEKRLSGHLGSEHWDMSPVADNLLRRSASLVSDDTLIVADLTDLAKYWARAMEGLGRVHDGSAPEHRTAPGYMVFEAYVRVGRWQLFPLELDLLKTYSGAPTSENAEILRHVKEIHQALYGRGTWVLDRGFDRDELMLPWLKDELSFIVRQRGDRHVHLADGRILAVAQVAAELQPPAWPRRWPLGGYTATREVWLPEDPEHALLLVVHWRRKQAKPLMLLVSPKARRPGRQAQWFVKAYRRRWGVEDATWGVKQRFHLEKFLVRSWRSIRRLLWLVAVAFFWLNLWGEERFDRLRNALLEHPWRLPKEVTYLFDWIALQLHQLLHPRPIVDFASG
jgi:DDE family transposase